MAVMVAENEIATPYASLRQYSIAIHHICSASEIGYSHAQCT